MKRVRGSALAVVGAQWGDEGKGKIVDLISPSFDLVGRWAGGHNAGHTVRFGEKHFALKLVPSGICRPNVLNLIGNGLVIDPRALLSEIEALRKEGVTVAENLKISDRAHVILPTHALLDGARERALGGANIGTTSRGIGPAYESKANRTGLRIADLVAPERFCALARPLLEHHDRILRHFYRLEGTPVDETLQRYIACGQEIAPFVTDTRLLLAERLAGGARLLCEGAQGLMLDVDHGTYPYVTSSSCGPGGAITGLGIPSRALDGVVGVMKAYTTRVGSGPFPTELHDETGERIRKRGNEYGTVTGRPRRVGWFDAVVAKSAVRIAGLDAVALMKLDVLDEQDEVKVAVAYEIDGEQTGEIPARADVYERAHPVYRTFPGWKAPLGGLESFDALPPKARRYVETLEELVGARVAILSIGPRREESIVRPGTGLDEWLTAAVAQPA